jgi:hypothetical protein
VNTENFLQFLQNAFQVLLEDLPLANFEANVATNG